MASNEEVYTTRVKDKERNTIQTHDSKYFCVDKVDQLTAENLPGKPSKKHFALFREHQVLQPNECPKMCYSIMFRSTKASDVHFLLAVTSEKQVVLERMPKDTVTIGRKYLFRRHKSKDSEKIESWLHEGMFLTYDCEKCALEIKGINKTESDGKQLFKVYGCPTLRRSFLSLFGR